MAFEFTCCTCDVFMEADILDWGTGSKNIILALKIDFVVIKNYKTIFQKYFGFSSCLFNIEYYP